MEDFIAYLILAIVIIWFCRNIYRKITLADKGGCGNGCENCSGTSDDCSDDPFGMKEK